MSEVGYMSHREKMLHTPGLEHIVILCFERRFSKQNSVIRQKSNILAPPKFLGWLRHWYFHIFVCSLLLRCMLEVLRFACVSEDLHNTQCQLVYLIPIVVLFTSKM